LVEGEEDGEFSLSYVSFGGVGCCYLSQVSYYGLLDEYALVQESTFRVFNPLFKKTGLSWLIVSYSLLGERFFEWVGVWLPLVWEWYFDCIHVYLKYLLKVNFTVERVVFSFVFALGSVVCIFLFVPSLVDLGPYDAEILLV